MRDNGNPHDVGAMWTPEGYVVTGKGVTSFIGRASSMGGRSGMGDLEKMKSGTYSYEPNASSFPQGKVSDDLIKRLTDASTPPQNGGGGGSWEQQKALLTGAATALAEAHATIARQQALLDRALEDNGDLMIEKARLEAALGGIKVMEPDRFHNNNRNDLIACAAWDIANGALSPVAPDQGEG